MPQRILGIDLGSWSVKAVLVESSFRGFRVEAAEEVVLPPGPPETRAERQGAALAQLLSSGLLRADVSVAAIGGEAVTLREIALPFSDSKKIDATIGGELADVLPFELDDAVFDHAVVRRSPDGGSVSLCAAVRRAVVEQRLALLKSAELDPRHLGVDVLQLASLGPAFLAQDTSRAELPAPGEPELPGEPEVGALDGLPEARLLVDIGHERTLVTAAGPAGVAHARVIRAGGRDVTEAIGRAYGLAFEDAEAGKHEDAWVASVRHPAPTDQASAMSEVVSRALAPLVRELRRTLQVIRSERRVRLARIDLVGGGARIRNLAQHLADQLGLPVAMGAAVEQNVERTVDAARRPAFALPLALALRPTTEGPAAGLDLRKGEFAFAGQLQNLRARLPFLIGSAAALLLLVLVDTAVRYQVVRRREAAVDRQFCEITKSVVGREICEPAIALSVIREPASELGTFKLPERSAFVTAAELSRLVPQQAEITLGELDVTTDRARVSGSAASFDAVDQIVAAYSADSCYTDINKGNIRKKSDGSGVEFQLSVRLRCTP